MLNFTSWINDAVAFLDGMRALPGEVTTNSKVAATISTEEIRSLSKGLRIEIPPPIERFLSQGSSGFDFRYSWIYPEHFFASVQDIFSDTNGYLHGGIRLCNAADFAVYQDGCRGSSIGWGLRGLFRDSEFLARSFPFAPIGTGDFLGLDVFADKNEPPVVYLSHDPSDSENYVLCKSFDQFLRHWKELCYTAPGVSGFAPFRDPFTGELKPKRELVRKLKTLFGSSGGLRLYKG